jgi:hypothetical protein
MCELFYQVLDRLRRWRMSGIESTIIGFEEESPVLYRLGSSIEEVEA